MMSALKARTTLPLRGERTGAATGAWGAALAAVVLAMFLAGSAAAALYLETAQPRPGVTADVHSGWPPPGISIPPADLAVLALALAIAGAVSMSWTLRHIASGRRPVAAGLTLAGSGLFLGAVSVLVADLRRVPFGWDVHAYTSVYHALTWTVIVLFAIGLWMAFAVAIQILVGVVDARRHLEVLVATKIAWIAAAAGVLLVSLIHLLPRLVAG